MVAGKEVSPKDVKNTERLKAYWDKGGKAINWGVPGDWGRCVDELAAATKGKMTPEQMKGYCADRHHDATGAWPGHAPGEKAAHAAKGNKGKGK